MVMGKPMSHLEQLSSSPHLCCCSSLAGAGDGLHTVRCWQLVWAALKPERQSWAALGYRTSAETQNPFVWIFRLKKTTTERCRNKRQKILRTLFDLFFFFLATTCGLLISSGKWKMKIKVGLWDFWRLQESHISAITASKIEVDRTSTCTASQPAWELL